MNQVPEEGMPERPPEMELALGSLHASAESVRDNIDRLDETIGAVEQRLVAVLRPVGPQVTTPERDKLEDVPVPTMRTGLGQRVAENAADLHTSAGRLGQFTSRLHTIIDRLEV